MSNLPKKLEGIFLSGWGNDLAIGAMSTLFDDISVDDAYDYIKNDKELIPQDLSQYRKFASHVDTSKVLNVEKVLSMLGRYRPDVCSVILNHPNGLTWLAKQIILLKQRLDIPIS